MTEVYPLIGYLKFDCGRGQSAIAINAALALTNVYFVGTTPALSGVSVRFRQVS